MPRKIKVWKFHKVGNKGMKALFKYGGHYMQGKQNIEDVKSYYIDLSRKFKFGEVAIDHYKNDRCVFLFPEIGFIEMRIKEDEGFNIKYYLP